MSKRIFALSTGLLAAVAAVFGFAGTAGAVQVLYRGEVRLQIATLDPLVLPAAAAVQVTVNGAGAATGLLSSLAMPTSPFAVTGFVLPVTDTGAFPIAGVQATGHNAAGNFSGTPAPSGSGNFGGQMSLVGASKVCLYGACGSSTNISNLTVPLSVVGQGGVVTVVGAVNLTVLGAPWTTGTAAIGTITQMGGVSPIDATLNPKRDITFVTPVFISTNIGAFAVVPAFAFIAPEPGAIVAFGSAIAVLTAIGVARSKKR
jgi:hypothetical protein